MKDCIVTHLKQPNKSGHSRGRKRHYTLDGKKSLCNMMVDIVLDLNKSTAYSSNRLCAICEAKSKL